MASTMAFPLNWSLLDLVAISAFQDDIHSLLGNDILNIRRTENIVSLPFLRPWRRGCPNFQRSSFWFGHIFFVFDILSSLIWSKVLSIWRSWNDIDHCLFCVNQCHFRSANSHHAKISSRIPSNVDVCNENAMLLHHTILETGSWMT